MKKLLAMLLAATMMFPLVACGKANDTPTNKRDDTSNIIIPGRDYDKK